VNGRFALNPHGRVTRYGGTGYIYDSRLTDSPLVELATAVIGEPELAAAELLRTRGFMIEPRTIEQIRGYLLEHGFDARMADRLVDLRLVQPHESHAEALERRVLDHFDRRYLPQDAELVAPQYGDGAQLAFSPGTFFNLPRGVAAEACQVGLLGVPIASLRASLGTVTGPAMLRLKSRTLCWFDVHTDGVYSEMTLEDGRPEVLCQGVVLRDCGDIDGEGLTLAELFERLHSTLAAEFFTRQVRPIVLGGDHAITGPIVGAFLEELPDLGLLHLDAHNDLFYTPQVVYSHAAPISNLISTTGIQRVASYGLRTFADKRMAGIRKVYGDVDAQDRLRLRSLTDTKRLVMDERRLEAELDALAGRPYFLTLDLDVLSEAAIGRRVSTPFGTGLEWHELLTFLDAVFRRLDVVGCDVVEYNGLNGDGREIGGNTVVALLLLLIDRLAKGNPKRPAGPLPVAATEVPQPIVEAIVGSR
jgi:arginase family enzyme